ncbi:isocitrate lyase/phosphoenolpyruvate mutase family protein [Cryptosporangium sp. NPDC048952]|uniref:isocitrate lyase/PEP mutase family protein n=1 Tax=Cryptosporangium sp. NPDC048952 TaxID=3363961 RepID=UPI00371EA474
MTEQTSQAAKARHFLELHRSERPLLFPNPWDVGSAVLLASLGFKALATTSSGHAATLGRLDGQVSREEALAHASALSAATDLPVAADFENGFADAPEAVAEAVTAALGTGLAGLSIEDATGRDADPIYDLAAATERIAAAASAAHAGPVQLVLTARAENYLYGRTDLADTIARLQAYQEAGADVLYAPGLAGADDIRAVVTSVDRPVNVLARPNGPTVAELAELGVSRVSVGGSFAFAALSAAVDAATEFRDRGTFSFLGAAREGSAAAKKAFS